MMMMPLTATMPVSECKSEWMMMPTSTAYSTFAMDMNGGGGTDGEGGGGGGGTGIDTIVNGGGLMMNGNGGGTMNKSGR